MLVQNIAHDGITKLSNLNFSLWISKTSNFFSLDNQIQWGPHSLSFLSLSFSLLPSMNPPIYIYSQLSPSLSTKNELLIMDGTSYC